MILNLRADLDRRRRPSFRSMDASWTECERRFDVNFGSPAIYAATGEIFGRVLEWVRRGRHRLRDWRAPLPGRVRGPPDHDQLPHPRQRLGDTHEQDTAEPKTNSSQCLRDTFAGLKAAAHARRNAPALACQQSPISSRHRRGPRCPGAASGEPPVPSYAEIEALEKSLLPRSRSRC